MGYMYEFPHSNMFDSDLRQIIEMYFTLKNLPNEWEEFKKLSDDKMITAVDEWLREHPEATTTVQDNSITEPKIQKDFLMQIKNQIITPQMFGAVGDGVTDDTEAIKTAINASKLLYFPAGKYKVTEELVITKNMSIMGTGKETQLHFHGCNGIVVDGENRQFYLHDIGLFGCAEDGQYPHKEFIGLHFKGVSNSIISAWNTVKDCLIYGWNTGIKMTHCWNTIIDSVSFIGPRVGIEISGLTVNNTIKNCNIGDDGTNEIDKCIYFTALDGFSGEGLVIESNILTSANYGIYFDCHFLYVNIVNNIIDLFKREGIHIYQLHSSIISNNWIGSIEGVGSIGIQTSPLNTSELHHIKIVNNSIQMPQVTSGKAINLYQAGYIVTGNNINIQSDYAIYCETNCNHAIISDNSLTVSGNTYGIFIGGSDCVVSNNIGTIPQYYNKAARNIITNNEFAEIKNSFTQNAPTSGTWKTGDVVYSSYPQPGGYIGYVCTADGTPGTWKGFGLIAT